RSIWTLTTQFLDLRSAAVLSIVQLVIVSGVLLTANAARNKREVALRLTSTAVSRAPLRWGADWPAIAVTAATGVFLLALPMVHLVAASLRTSGGGGLGSYRALGPVGADNALP